VFTIADARKLKGARKVIEVCANTQPGERVLILADMNTVKIGELLAIASMGITDNTVLSVITPRTTHGAEPPTHIASAMRESDVLVMPLTYSMTHASVVEEARKTGARVLSMGDFTESMLEKGGIDADFLKLQKVVDHVAEFLTKGKRVRMTTGNGTDITMDISGRQGNSEPGLSREPGSFSSPPNMEANIGPVEGTSEGLLYVDAAIPHPALGVIGDPITLVVKEGQIVEIQGGKQADVLRAVLNEMNDPAIYNIAELGIGLNPCSRICGSMLEDEGCYGTGHIGIGDNLAYGGHVKSKGHIDVIMHSPTIEIDGVCMEKDGQLTFDLEEVNDYESA